VRTPRRAPKPWYASKTIWLQIIGATIAIVAVFAASPTFRPYAEGFAIAQSILTIVLRVITDTPIQGGPKDGS
jgi:hypothetical protein